MKPPTKEEIKAHLKMRRAEFPRDFVAVKVGVSLSTLNNYLAHKDMPDDMRYNIAKLTGMLQVPNVEEVIPDNIINLKVPFEDHQKWEKAALAEKTTVSDWLIETGNQRAAEILESEFGITHMPKTKSSSSKIIHPEQEEVSEQNANGGENSKDAPA